MGTCVFNLLMQATKGKQRMVFYTMPEYEAWKESLGGVTTGWSIKYYKVPAWHDICLWAVRCCRHNILCCLPAVCVLFCTCVPASLVSASHVLCPGTSKYGQLATVHVAPTQHTMHSTPTGSGYLHA